VAYYAPLPDPDAHFLGMSWITPVLRELQGDQASTEHKWRFFENAATPNMAIKFDPAVGIDAVRQFKELLEEEHRGVANAFRTLFLGGGAVPVPVGSSFKDMDYAVIQGRAESRLAAAAGVPPSWVGFAEGLQGSSLNAGNFQSARRRFSDGTMVHLWGNAASSLQPLLATPPGAALTYDPRVPFMREDASDLAAIQEQEAATIAALVNNGFTPESVIKAVKNNVWSALVHSGMLSVQLQPPSSGLDPLPGFGTPAPASNGHSKGSRG
jgi:phage portal protein BeeE